ncbi:hypothetical protein HTZ84_14000 [Haloterrigena sp. SYSU A558-1]|uniref:GvpH protein n=1 Tax=Haloterrigena gelatinilytica TaxID=2741724 RepID=A0A8J8GJF9_9EURY|nr:gas vesicle protein GvpH [Haloterrigena gelatinilytica]NUB90771.1 hypothetical protein [Haloterrigena gelatinilytica]NUC73412.1 hypothetical protein [Haloterrigena gelatinilytica]
MSDERSSDGDDTAAEDDDDERADATGFRLEAGLRPLKELLGALIEVTVTDAPPPTTETTDRSTVDDETRRPSDEPRRTIEADRTRTKRHRRSPADECLVDTRREAREFVVTADVLGASRDDLSVGIDPRTNDLVIGVNGTVVERVDPPWRSVEATTVWFNNGILEVRLRPDES